jgi:hypothetical protein
VQTTMGALVLVLQTELVVAEAEARAADEEPDLAADASSVVVEEPCPALPPASPLPS